VGIGNAEEGVCGGAEPAVCYGYHGCPALAVRGIPDFAALAHGDSSIVAIGDAIDGVVERAETLVASTAVHVLLSVEYAILPLLSTATPLLMVVEALAAVPKVLSDTAVQLTGPSPLCSTFTSVILFPLTDSTVQITGTSDLDGVAHPLLKRASRDNQRESQKQKAFSQCAFHKTVLLIHDTPNEGLFTVD
jgi:hypothetical protein